MPLNLETCALLIAPRKKIRYFNHKPAFTLKVIMSYWLMKSEPDVFGIDDLNQRPNKTEPWDGVRNYQVRNMLRDQMQLNDLAFFYHSSCETPGIAGIIKIVKTGYVDDSAFDPTDHHYDPKSSLDNPRWYKVDVKFVQKFKHVIALSELRKNPLLENMQLLKKGNRLSIMPVTTMEWQTICEME